MAETTLDSTPTGNKKLSAESAQKLSPIFETFLTSYDKSTEGQSRTGTGRRCLACLQ